MAKQSLPVFTRDHRKGSMKMFTGVDLKGFMLANEEIVQRYFHVLVALDDETDRVLTIWHLGKAWPLERNMIVHCASDGEEALEKIRTKQFALIVLDWSLPHQKRASVLQTIREKGLNVPVVVVSDQSLAAIANELESMAAAFVNKDELDPATLHDAIATSMRMQEKRC